MCREVENKCLEEFIKNNNFIFKHLIQDIQQKE